MCIDIKNRIFYFFRYFNGIIKIYCFPKNISYTRNFFPNFVVMSSICFISFVIHITYFPFFSLNNIFTTAPATIAATAALAIPISIGLPLIKSIMVSTEAIIENAPNNAMIFTILFSRSADALSRSAASRSGLQLLFHVPHLHDPVPHPAD